MSRENFWIAVALITGILVAPLPSGDLVVPAPLQIGIPSAVVWQDDFNNSDLEGWRISALNYSDEGRPCNASFSVEDGFLLANDSDLLNIAWHDSSVSYGTWDFDIRVENTSVQVLTRVYFVTSNTDILFDPEIIGGPFGYYLGIRNNNSHGELEGPGLEICHMVNDLAGNFGELVGGVTIESGMVGWYHITITRTAGNSFKVYLNGSLVIDVIDTDTAYVSLEGDEFMFVAQYGMGIDNVVVSDSIDYETDPPEWLETREDQTILVGSAFRYDLNTTDQTGVSSWWLNDTTRFTIDAHGVITNATVLGIGRYALGVFVNDTCGNVLSGELSIRVVQRFAFVLPILGLGGVGLCIVAVVLLLRKRDA